MFVCSSISRNWVESFVEALVGTATQSTAEEKLKFSKIESSVESKINQKLSTPTQRRCRKEPIMVIEKECIEEEEEQDASTQFPKKTERSFL